MSDLATLRSQGGIVPSTVELREVADFAPHNPQINSALTQMLQRTAIARGGELGTDVLRNLARYEPLYDDHVQYANFEVLRDPLIPSILVETAFLSNPPQAKELHEYRFREQLAAAIYRGIREFLEHHNLSPGHMVTHRNTERATVYAVGFDQRLPRYATACASPGRRLAKINIHRGRLQIFRLFNS